MKNIVNLEQHNLVYIMYSERLECHRPMKENVMSIF